MQPSAPWPISDGVLPFLSLTSGPLLCPLLQKTVSPSCFVEHITFFTTQRLFLVSDLLSSPLLIPQDSAHVFSPQRLPSHLI